MKKLVFITVLSLFVGFIQAGDVIGEEFTDIVVENDKIQEKLDAALVLGDANGDGALSAADAVLLANYLAENPVGTISLDNANLTRTGKVNIVDLSVLQGVLVGHPFTVFTSPQNGGRYDGNLSIPVRVDIIALNGVDNTKVYLNGDLMFTMKESPWITWTWNLPYAGEGWNETRAVTTDKAGLVSTAILMIYVVVQ